MSDKFHRAARDGYVDKLKEATKKDLNTADEDGLTPTAWAAYEGNLEALRLIVGRGGDPEKCDHYGNTSLHCAAARGHMSCVSYLVNFKVNVWSLDNELHTAKELAAINGRDDILRYLDHEFAKQEQSNNKQVKKKQEKALKDAEKRRKSFEKIQKDADKQRSDEEEKLKRERERIEKIEDKPDDNRRKSILNTISRGSLAFLQGPRKDSTLLYNTTKTVSPKFSDLTTNTQNNSSNNNNKIISGIQKKIIRKKVLDETTKKNSSSTQFKVRETEGDGKRSVRNLSGLQRDSEILFVPNGSMSSTSSGGKRGKISDVFNETEPDGGGGRGNHLSRTRSEPDFAPRGSSLFDRPGFGSVAFRPSITATLGSYGATTRPDNANITQSPSPTSGSLGSTASFIRDESNPWEDEDLPSDDESEDAPVYLFLAAAGLTEFIPTFSKEMIDLESLMLLTEEDLLGLHLPMGPRRKLLKAIKDRKDAISNPGEVEDSHL